MVSSQVSFLKQCANIIVGLTRIQSPLNLLRSTFIVYAYNVIKYTNTIPKKSEKNSLKRIKVYDIVASEETSCTYHDCTEGRQH